MPNSLGYLIINELGHRGLHGAFFDYETYQVLKPIDSAVELQAFLDKEEFQTVMATDDPVWVVDGLEEANVHKLRPAEFAAYCGDLLIVAGPILLAWQLYRIMFPKYRAFPIAQANASRYGSTNPEPRES